MYFFYYNILFKVKIRDIILLDCFARLYVGERWGWHDWKTYLQLCLWEFGMEFFNRQ